MSEVAKTKLLSAALDRLIPAIDELPGAGEMGLAGEITSRCKADDRFWNAHTTVIDQLSAIDGFIDRDGSDQDEAISVVEQTAPNEFGLWLDVVYTIYYMQPSVHQHLDWHGRPPQPEGNVMPPWDESVLNVIKEREPFWRKV